MDKLLESVMAALPAWKMLLAGALASPLLAFFNVPALHMLFLILVVDFITGLYKARALKRLTSNKFSGALERAFGYAMIFTVMHALTVISPLLFVVEQAILAGCALREAISVVENIKTVELYKGRENKVLDKLVELLGLNLDKLLADADKGAKSKTHKEETKDETNEGQ
jgi:phage-related holin